MERILIENSGPIVENVKLALATAFQAALKSGFSDIVIVCASKTSFSGSVIEDVLGDSLVKKLLKDQKILVDNGLYFSLTTSKNINQLNSKQIVLAYYLLAKDMNKLDANSSVSVLVSLPWLEEEGKQWLSLWYPDVSVSGSLGWINSVQGFQLPIPVENVLKSLVFKSVTHPTDKARAKEKFGTLKKSGHHLDSIEVESWAIKNGWKSLDAKNLAQLVAQIFK